jgi:hypothetical protein
MRRVSLIFASVLISLTCAPGVDAALAKKAVSSRKLGLSIRVEGGGWGSVHKSQIETVLYSVADELLSRLPAKLAAPIVVTHSDSNPLALYDRGPQGEYLVHLHARDARWHLYAYEFAHELCHIMSNFEQNAEADSGRHNQWFEETLCETASLFTLKSLAATWEAAPPAPELSEHAPKLRRFIEMLVNESHRQLPLDTPLAAWLMANEDRLRDDPYQREKNEAVATLLLPLFERNPENWDALCYLNLDPTDARNSLQQYLRNWYHNAPAEHRSFIAGVLALVGVADALPGEAPMSGGAADASPAAVLAPNAALTAQAGRVEP